MQKGTPLAPHFPRPNTKRRGVIILCQLSHRTQFHHSRGGHSNPILSPGWPHIAASSSARRGIVAHAGLGLCTE